MGVLNFFIVGLLLLACGCGKDTKLSINIPATVQFDNRFSCFTTTGDFPEASANWANYPERLDPQADILALESTLNFSSSDLMYQQIKSDLEQIRSGFGSDQLVYRQVSPCVSFDSLIIGLDQHSIEQFRSGNFDAWQPINDRFGVESINEIGSSAALLLTFKRRYYMPTLVEVYRRQSILGVNFVETNALLGSSQDVCLENKIDFSRIYIFSLGEGDCPAGCIHYSYSGYLVNSDQTIQHLGYFSTDSASQPPAWFRQSRFCRAFL